MIGAPHLKRLGFNIELAKVDGQVQNQIEGLPGSLKEEINSPG